MTPPPIRTRLLGHPVIFMPIAAVALWSVWLLIQNYDAWPITAVACGVMNVALKANQARAEYLAWKRSWDQMAPATARRRRPKALWGILAVGAIVTYLFMTRDQSSHAMALGWMAMVAVMTPIIIAIRALRRRKIRHRPTGTPVVTICVTQPVLPVPDLATAYKTLPAHCHQVM